MRKVIIDGDWGGDEMQLAAVLLAHPEEVKVLGATAVFGNTTHGQVLKNAGSLMAFLGAEQVPYFPGAAGPCGRSLAEGDGAHGADGVGGVALPPSPLPPQGMDAADFILDTLRSNPRGTVTITATGPLTNIALALAKNAPVMKRAAGIVIMGGCTQEMPARDMPFRKGNITPDAEFNFYMAPEDAAAVMNSGLPVTLFPMNCTHQMTFTPARENMLRGALATEPVAADAVARMMKAPEALDRMKFDSSPVMHDVHTALYILHPEYYEGRRGRVDVITAGEATGRTDFLPGPAGPVMVMETIRDPDRLFSVVLGSLESRLLPHAGMCPVSGPGLFLPRKPGVK